MSVGYCIHANNGITGEQEMKLLTYQLPKFSESQLKSLGEMDTPEALTRLGNAFQLIEMNYAPENMARPVSRRVHAQMVSS